MGKNYRQGRLGEEIKKSISQYLVNGIKDPRLSNRIITISAVEVSSDGSYANVFFTPLTLYGEDKEMVNGEVLAALNKAKGPFRTKISRDIKLRHAPELTFRLDSSMEYGRHIDEIIDGIKVKEEQ